VVEDFDAVEVCRDTVVACVEPEVHGCFFSKIFVLFLQKQSFMLHMLFQLILYFYYRYCLSCWEQTGILHGK
jgi:hypothetical protein